MNDLGPRCALLMNSLLGVLVNEQQSMKVKRGFNNDGKGGRSEGCSAERSDTVRVGGR